MTCDEDLVERVREVLAAQENLREQAMFGGRAFLVNGNMAVAASSHGGLMVRADPATAPALLEEPDTEPVRMRGREMRGWVHVLSDGVRTEDALERWTRIGLAHAQSLPAK